MKLREQNWQEITTEIMQYPCEMSLNIAVINKHNVYCNKQMVCYRNVSLRILLQNDSINYDLRQHLQLNDIIFCTFLHTNIVIIVYFDMTIFVKIPPCIIIEKKGEGKVHSRCVFIARFSQVNLMANHAEMCQQLKMTFVIITKQQRFVSSAHGERDRSSVTSPFLL